MSSTIDENTVQLLNSEDFEEKRRMLERESAGGHCYLLLFLYFFQLSTLSASSFEDVISTTKTLLKSNPESFDAYTTVFSMVTRKLYGVPDTLTSQFDDIAIGLYERTKLSKIRLILTELENGMLHLKIGEQLTCECAGPVCQHGYDFTMTSAVLNVQSKKKLGASGFNIDDFLEKGLDGEDECFEEAYSQLTVDKTELLTKAQDFVRRSDKKNGTNIAKTLGELPAALQPPPPPLPTLPKRKAWTRPPQNLRAQIATEAPPRTTEMINSFVQREFEFPKEDDQVTIGRQETISPNDSSSVLGRYNRRFMRQGTVLSVLSERPEQAPGTVLTVQNHLVEGFYMTPEMQQLETEAVTDLRPINGLVQPFKDNRLNFLMNLNTGLIRCLKYDPTDLVRCVFHTMRTRPSSPADNLLNQVLNVTVDKRTMLYKSNPFKLPYIRVGMQVTRVSIQKVLDLTGIELQTLWHTEMCDLIVPEHHSMYLSARVQSPRQSQATPQKTARPKSILGF